MKRMTDSKRIDIVQRTGVDPVKTFRAARMAATKKYRQTHGYTTRQIIVRGRAIPVETLR